MSRVNLIGTMLVVAAVVLLAACSGQGQARPLPAPTTIAGASAGVVTVTQEDVVPPIPPESGVVVGFEGGQYLIATTTNFQLPASVSVPGTTQSAQATSMYACMDGPWRILAVSAADLPQLPVLELGAWTVGPAWLAIAGFEPADVQVHGPVNPFLFDQYDWGASPDNDLVQFTPSVAQAVDWPPAFSPTEFGGAALLEQVAGGVLLVGLADGLLGNAGNTEFVGVATGPEDIEYLLNHPGGC